MLASSFSKRSNRQISLAVAGAVLTLLARSEGPLSLRADDEDGPDANAESNSGLIWNASQQGQMTLWRLLDRRKLLVRKGGVCHRRSGQYGSVLPCPNSRGFLRVFAISSCCQVVSSF